jgi:hypothetical protein
LLDGVTIEQEQVSDLGYRAMVSAPDGGRVVFSRLSWPGYSATLDGDPLPVSAVDDMFVSVQVPARTEAASLALAYQPPGLAAGLAGLALGTGIVALLALLQLRARRSARVVGDPADADPATSSRDMRQA